MTNPYRTCLAELLSKIDYTWGDIPADVRDLMDRARALLAQPEPEGPTDDKLMDIARATDLVFYMGKGCGFASPYQEGTDITAEVLAFARAVITADRARALLGHQDPQPLVAGEVVSYEDICQWLEQQAHWGDNAYLVPRVANIVRDAIARWGRPTPQPESVAPTDEELTLTYAYAVAAAVGNKRGPFDSDEAEAAQLAGLRAVLAKWGHQ